MYLAQHGVDVAIGQVTVYGLKLPASRQQRMVSIARNRWLGTASSYQLDWAATIDAAWPYHLALPPGHRASAIKGPKLLTGPPRSRIRTVLRTVRIRL